MTQGQFEFTAAEALSGADAPSMTVESTSAEVTSRSTQLAIQAELVSAESLSRVLVTSMAEGIYAEVLVPAGPLAKSNVWDWTETEHDAYLWNGTLLIHTRFGT